MSSMKVLFIFSVGFDYEHSSTILMNNILEELEKYGIAAHYIAPIVSLNASNYPHYNFDERLISYDSIFCKQASKSNLIKRYLSGVKYAIKIRKYVKVQSDCDCVYVQSTATGFWTMASLKSCTHNIPLIYSNLDMFPGSTIAAGKMPWKGLQQIFYFLQKKMFKMADHIMAMSEDMKHKIHELGIPNDKITAWNTWYDNDRLHPVEDMDNSFISEYGIDRKKFYVQYAGNVGYVYDVETLINVAERLKGYHNIVFQIVGHGSQIGYIEKEIGKRELTNVKILPFQPVSRISEVYSSCDIQFIPLKKGVIGNSFPSKLAHVMACGKTFICSIDKTSFFEFTENYEIGKCYEIGNYDGIVNAILEFYNSKELLKTYCKNASECAKKFFSKQRNTSIIIDTIKMVAYKR